MTTVAATEFQNSIGKYLEESAKAPVHITKHGREVRVLLDAEEYRRLLALDTRKSLAPSELPDDIKAEFTKGYTGPSRPDLDHLNK